MDPGSSSTTSKNGVNIFLLMTFCVLMSDLMAQPSKVSSKEENSVGGGCEGCDLMYVNKPAKIESFSTLVKPTEPGEKLEISGTIYKPDGKTPAPGVILYIYQTATSGHYEPAQDQTGGVRRHGRIRGWVKSNEKGEYKFSTIRPGSYPNSSIAAHIHPTIKEPDKNEYFIDDFVFSDDSFVDENYRSRQNQRGGSGIIDVKKVNGVWVGKRDITLGLNIPNYPK